MMQGRRQSSFRFGHTMAVFGFFISLITLIFQGSIPSKTIAFGTSEIAILANQYRTNSGLSELIINDKLTISAQSKADHMATNGYFEHDAPDGTTPWFFFAQAGYSYSSAGENLALSNQSASKVVSDWYNSDGHRANMMSTVFTEVGYGIAFVNSFTYKGVEYPNVYLVAAHYGKPAYTAPTPAATTPAPTPAEPAAQSSQPVAASTESPPPSADPTSPNPTPTPTPKDETKAAPSGFVEEPSNTSRSGTYENVQKSPPSISSPLTYAGVGTGGVFVAVGSTFEIRRLLRHESLIPRLKHKK